MLTREELPLTAEDTIKLRRNMIPMLIFPIVVVVFFYLVGSFIFNDMGDSFAESGIQWGFLVFGLFFMGIIGYMIWSQAIDIKRGIKERVEGVVTDKRLDIKTSTRSAGGSRNGRRTRTTRYYYMYVEGEEFKVDFKHYSQVKTGDHIVMERTPRAGFILNLGVISQADEATRQHDDRMDAKFLNTQVQELPLTAEDRAAMDRYFKSTLRRKITFMLPLLFIIGCFIASGIGALLLFLFPIVIIPLVQLIGIVRLTIRHSKSKGYGYKAGVTAVVEDKLTVTGNRTSTSHRLITSWGRLSVSTEIYDALETDDKIVLYKPRYGKQPISITTLDNKVFYLG
ncbi:MAG: hypothetical protein Roseis2KO_41380 [Roseivirga sp.]